MFRKGEWVKVIMGSYTGFDGEVVRTVRDMTYIDIPGVDTVPVPTQFLARKGGGR
jgi:ribosomal protein L24